MGNRQCYRVGAKREALRNAKVLDSKVLNVTKDVAIEMEILTLIKKYIYYYHWNSQAVNRRTNQRGLDVLKSTGTIKRKDSKWYGYWEVCE